MGTWKQDADARQIRTQQKRIDALEDQVFELSANAERCADGIALLRFLPVLKLLFGMSAAVYESRTSGAKRLEELWMVVVQGARDIGVPDAETRQMLALLDLHEAAEHGDGCPVCRAMRG